jgi:hypothetical protein
MFSNKEATQIAARALETHAGAEAAQEFRNKFDRSSSELVPPPREAFDPFYNHTQAQVTYLLHVSRPGVVDSLAQAARGGDKEALQLLAEVATNPHGQNGHRFEALSTLAGACPAKAAEVALALQNDDRVNFRLGETLIRDTRTPELIPALERLATDHRYEVRESAMSALVELGEPGSEALARLMFAPSEDVRHTATSAVLRQKLATPIIVNAIERFAHLYPERSETASQLRQSVSASGLSWKVGSVVDETRARLDALDGLATGADQAHSGHPRTSSTLLL